jgi:ribose transport system ATP-binding protein
VNTVSLSNVSQRFGAVQALNQVGLTLRSSEVRALIGANGSGKSTLVKVVAGFHIPDDGQVDVNGEVRELSDPRAVSELWKVAIVHQDLGLIDGLSVLENFLLSDLSQNGSTRIDWREKSKLVKKYLTRFGVKASPYRKINGCSRVDRALIALARAVWEIEKDAEKEGGESKPATLILDEITAFLTIEEVQFLKGVIQDIVKHGHSVLFVSHDLDEILTLADQITVLRDGVVVADQPIEGVSKDQLFTLIAGRSADEFKTVPTADIANVGEGARVQVSALAAGDGFMGPVNFEVSPGEVLGLTGLVGSGYERVPYVMFGAEKGSTGTYTFNQRTIDVARLDPPTAIQLGVALVPGNRNAQGLWGDLTIAENLSVADRESRLNPWLLSWRKLWNRGEQIVREYAVKAESAHTRIRTLSGGNAQRVLLAKGMAAKPSILLLHEPVQGVDVGSRSHIASVILDRAAGGIAIVVASSDHEFLAQVASRVLVFSRGQIVEQLKPPAGLPFVDKDQMVYACQTKVATVVSQ